MDLYFKAKITSIEMARDRGYLIESYDDDYLLGKKTKEDFFAHIKNEKGQINWEALEHYHVDKSGINVLYFYFVKPSETTKHGASVAQIIVNKFNNWIIEYRRQLTVILIAGQSFTSKEEKTLTEVEKGVKYEIFDIRMMSFNLTKHMYASRYVVLSKEEMKEFLKKNKIDIKSLEQRSYQDPVCRYYGWNVGQIVKSYKQNLSAETMVTNSLSYFHVVRIPLATK